MLKINVGLSRKVTQDYNSKGYSLNIEAELPGDVVSDPEVLARKADSLFALADRLLDEQITPRPRKFEGGQPTNGNGHANHGDTRRDQPNHGGYNHRRHEGSSTDNGPQNASRSNGIRLLTAAQGRAIQVMAHKLEADADELARQEFGTSGVAELNVKQASAFIDLLKKELDQKQATQGVGR